MSDGKTQLRSFVPVAALYTCPDNNIIITILQYIILYGVDLSVIILFIGSDYL